MSRKRVVVLELASSDVERAVDHYAEEAGVELALAFVDELEAALADLGERPGAGSTRYAHEVGIPGLRTWSRTRFPHLLFYLERDDHVDLWRVLHPHRDLVSLIE